MWCDLLARLGLYCRPYLSCAYINRIKSEAIIISDQISSLIVAPLNVLEASMPSQAFHCCLALPLSTQAPNLTGNDGLNQLKPIS